MCVLAFSDVDECVDGNRCVNGTCSNTEGSYLCHCDAGYRLEPTNQTCQGKNLESKTISFFYHPPPTRSFLVGLLVCWLVGSAVCQILMSVLTWGRLFVGFGPVRNTPGSYRCEVPCPPGLSRGEHGVCIGERPRAPASAVMSPYLHIMVLIRAVCLSLVA